MSGEELDKKLKDAGYVLADVARLLGVPPQSLNQTLNAKDVKSGFLEDLCKALGKDMGFFYGISVTNPNEEMKELRKENEKLKKQIDILSNIPSPSKESKVYKLWMKFMEITSEMQELYKEEKER